MVDSTEAIGCCLRLKVWIRHGTCDFDRPNSVSHYSNTINIIQDTVPHSFVFVKGNRPGGELAVQPPPERFQNNSQTQLKINSELSFIEKDLGFVQTRDQELLIALFKSIKLQLTRKLELEYIF